MLKKLIAGLLLALCVVGANADTTLENYGDASYKIRIKLCTNTAFAICSLTFRGLEYVNNYDHGRQFQSASSFDGLGEAFNPTQAGSNADGLTSNPSSSLLQGWWKAPGSGATICTAPSTYCNNQAATQSLMAYWLPVNGVVRSNHQMNTDITIGWAGMPNVIQYLAAYTVPSGESHSHAVFEALTGYMPTTFTYFYTLDVKGGATTPVLISDGPGEQTLPLIFTTPDYAQAIGVYSPDLPNWSGAGYGRFRFSDTVKWNMVFRYDNPSGVYNLRTYFVVGTFNEVVDRMKSFRTYPF